jgi:hypothetical protein
MTVYLHEGNTQDGKYNYIMTYPRDMSTGSISLMCPAITLESSMSFKASSLLHVAVNPSPIVSKLAWGYRDFKILKSGSLTASCWQE